MQHYPFGKAIALFALVGSVVALGAHAQPATPTIQTLEPEQSVFVAFEGRLTDGSEAKALRLAFEDLDQYLAARKLYRKAGAHPIAFIQSFDEASGVVHGEAAIAIGGDPAHKASSDGRFRVGATPAGRAVRFETHRPYGEMNDDYEGFAAWMHDHGIKPKSEAWEVYVRQGPGIPGPSLLTYVYYLVD